MSSTDHPYAAELGWTAANRANWDDRAHSHLLSRGDEYDMERIRRGQSSLRALEVELAGPVAGTRLLHLMCHLGHDSISWARLGAAVTAVDFSPVAIEAARDFARDRQVQIEFCVADVFDLAKTVTGEFSTVVLTYGVLPWLRDLRLVMREIADVLAPHGRLVLIDAHPLTALWPYGASLGEGLSREANYFGGSGPIRAEKQFSYGGGPPLLHPTSYQWQHTLAEITRAVIEAGLRLETLREEPFGFYRRYPGMTRRADGYLDPPPDAPKVPLILALTARKR